MLVVDGPPADESPLARFPTGPILFPGISEGGVVFLDDANRAGERLIVERWLGFFPTLHVERLNCEKGCAMLQF